VFVSVSVPTLVFFPLIAHCHQTEKLKDFFFRMAVIRLFYILQKYFVTKVTYFSRHIFSIPKINGPYVVSTSQVPASAIFSLSMLGNLKKLRWGVL